MIQRCQEGDTDAWQRLFALHYEPVARFVFQQSADFTLEDAEELAQETFLTAIRRLGTFHGESSLQNWLYRIAMNKGRDLIEQRQAAKRGAGQQPVPLQSTAADGNPIDPPAAGPGPDAQTASRDDFTRLRRALDRLGGGCRDLIELRYFGDLTYEQLAAESDMTVKTVTARLAKCLQRLAELIQEAPTPGPRLPV